MKHTRTYNHQSQFIEMFGNLPEKANWESVLTIINGKKFPGEYQTHGKYKICGSGGTMGYGDISMCPANSIILGRKGNINTPIYMDEPYWIVDTAYCLQPLDLLHPFYLYYWCKQYDFTRLNKQAVLPSLTKNDLYAIQIAVPPMKIQEEFAAIVRQADKSKFGGFKSQFIEMFGKYASTARLEDLSETIIAGGDKPKDCTTYRTESNVYPVIANGIENDGIIGYSSSYRIDSPSLTISARGTIGVTAIRSGMYTPIIRLIVIQPLRNINLTYLKYQLDYNGFQPTGAVQGQLTVPNVKNKLIPVPPLSDQEEFAAIVRQADKSKYYVQNKLNKICHILTNQIQSRRCS